MSAKTIRPLTTIHSDLEAFTEHLVRHMNESGRNGSILFAPYPTDSVWKEPERKDQLVSRLQKPMTEPGATRIWGLFEQDNVIGHVDLKVASLVTASHRAILGMGLEERYRGKGEGSRLLDTAIGWARRSELFAWIDLRTFGHNDAALRLYRRAGFVEQGRLADMFRIAGKSIDDVLMSLEL